jgi:hypothetical protein
MRYIARAHPSIPQGKSSTGILAYNESPIVAFQLAAAKIRPAQIGTGQRGPNQEGTTKPGITEVGRIQLCMTESGATRAERRSCQLRRGRRLAALRWPSGRTPYRLWRGRRSRDWPKRDSPHLNAPGINPHGRSTPALRWRRRDLRFVGSSFAIFHPCQVYGQLRSAVAVGPIELSLCQAFDPFQIGIRQICAVELCQAQRVR